MSKKSWNIKKIFKEIISTIIIFFLVSMVLNYIRKPDIKENIYDYKLVDTHGQGVDFSSYKGKPLIVHFWATWCPTCKLEASNIDDLSKEYNVVSIAVTSGDNEAINDFMQKHQLTYKVISDAEGSLAKKFNIQAYPTTLIYTQKGKLKFAEVGYSTTVGLKARLHLSNSLKI